MPIFRLDNRLWFPPPKEFESDGIVAIGGDLQPARILLAYAQGIFPWYNEGQPICWWSPTERMVLKPHEVKISRSSRNLLNRRVFRITADNCFEEVIEQCQKVPRKGQDGTWLNDELKAALIQLHHDGFAHSVESWYEGELVGGLYGISIGGIFFGDSMFSRMSNASKIAFIHLCKVLSSLNFQMIDCQIYNDHLASLGAYEISRAEFLKFIQSNDLSATLQHGWEKYF